MPTITPSIPSAGQTMYCHHMDPSDNSTNYLPIEGYRDLEETLAKVECKMDRPTTFHSLRVYVSAVPIGFGHSVAITLVKNGTDTALSVTIDSGATTNAWLEDLTHIAEFAPGDRAALKVVKTGTLDITCQTITMARITS